MSLNRLTLVLNASYEPINVIGARRALMLVLGGKAHVEEPSGHFIRTSKMSIQIPSVVRLLVYRRMPRQNRAVSRKSIMMRDRSTCQYRHRLFDAKKLTLDHVIPRCRGGGSTWENLVAACYACNNRKADRTPAEAGMALARQPAPIGIHAKHRLTIGSAASAWDKYLFC
jgi:5-methylcytosine-specific restriction endonuclease McrA